MKIGFTIALLAVAVLCFSAIAQEQNAKYWYEKGLKLNANQSYDEAVQAYDNAIKLDPGKPEYWDGKALTLYFLHRNLEATESWKKALQLYNNTLVKNSKDADAWMRPSGKRTCLRTYPRPGLKKAWYSRSRATTTSL